MSEKRDPTLWPFGSETTEGLGGLTLSEQSELGVHERIERIWPLLVRLCRKAAASMNRGVTVMLVEDLLQDVSVALVAWDHRWKPERGKYTTFVALTVRKICSRQREANRVVPAPHNAWSNLQQLCHVAQHQDLNQKQQRTLQALETVFRPELPYTEPGDDDGEKETLFP